jgi:hypothetical protein
MVMAKKKFKFEMWMLGALILPIGIGIAIYSASLQNSVELGGSCTDRQQCKAPADACMSLGGDSVCTVMCNPGCPAGFECVELDVTMQNQGGFHEMKGVRYCFTKQLAASLTAPGGS